MADQAGDKVLWFVAGAAVGAAIALLCAPVTGEELRRQISSKAGEGRQTLADGGKDLLDKGRDLYERGRQIADDAAEMFEQGKKLVQNNVPQQGNAPQGAQS